MRTEARCRKKKEQEEEGKEVDRAASLFLQHLPYGVVTRLTSSLPKTEAARRYRSLAPVSHNGSRRENGVFKLHACTSTPH